MPEASVNLDDGIPARQDQIWAAGKVLVVEPKTKALCVQSSPNSQFRLGILSLDLCHHSRASLLVNDIDQLFTALAWLTWYAPTVT